jgi:P-type Ca2+ transporter type 2C
MGITGTEVAKQASDMVLADDNFSTIVKAVEEGRSIYSNMQAFIRYLISSNIGEVLSIFFTAMLGIPEGFNSVQLLWVNLVTDGPPATALGFNPSDRDIMQKPPRRADDPLINGWVFFRYMVVGTYVGLATVGIFIYWYTMAETADGHTLVTIDQLMNWSECPTWENFTVHNYHESFDFSENPCDYFLKGKAKASCLSLSVLVLIEMLNALNAISADASLLQMNPFVNPYLLAAIANSMLLHAMILYVPVMNEIFSITSLNQEEWMLVIAFSAPVLLCEEVLKIVSRRMNAAELQ